MRNAMAGWFFIPMTSEQIRLHTDVHLIISNTYFAAHSILELRSSLFTKSLTVSVWQAPASQLSITPEPNVIVRSRNRVHLDRRSSSEAWGTSCMSQKQII